MYKDRNKKRINEPVSGYFRYLCTYLNERRKEITMDNSMELEAYKAELAREILMSNSRQLLDKVKMVLHSESSTNVNVVKEDCEEYKPRTKTEVLSDLREACEEARLIREGKAKGISAEDLLNEL